MQVTRRGTVYWLQYEAIGLSLAASLQAGLPNYDVQPHVCSLGCRLLSRLANFVYTFYQQKLTH
jgi:hypothetical protein